MDKTREAIFSLRPVTFRYKKTLDPEALPQFGLVAEQVAKVNLDLVAWDAEGKPFTVRYNEVNAMLLNEFLKEHRKVEEQTATIAQVQVTNSEQQKEIEALSSVLKAQAARTVEELKNAKTGVYSRHLCKHRVVRDTRSSFGTGAIKRRKSFP